MKLLNHNAPALLLEKAKSLGDRPQSWRCIHIGLSEIEQQYSSYVIRHFVIEAIAVLLGNDEGYVYVCDDGDVFILFQGALKPVLSRLSSHFDGMWPPQLDDQPEDNLFTIFDLGRHYTLFLRFCTAKAKQAGQERSRPQIQFRQPRRAEFQE